MRFVLGSQAFADGYDANGNMTTHLLNGARYLLSYDAENRLVGVSGVVAATFMYDGDGNRVKGTIGTTTTTYIGNYFEWKTSTSDMKKYYYAGSTRVAMRTGSSTLNYLLGDHLGSTAITTNSSGTRTAEIRYYPWGTTRYTYGSNPTTFQYTGKRLQSELGLYFYNARWYDSAVGRFTQPDTIAPGGVQGLDRYAYVGNNPLRYTDPSRHDKKSNECGPDGIYCDKNRVGQNVDIYVLNNEELYDVLVDLGYFTPPSISDIKNPENRPSEIIKATIDNYVAIRRELFIRYKWKYIDISGKINDNVIMSFIIYGEFGVYKNMGPDIYGNSAYTTYNAALGALSKQYNIGGGNIQCGSNGCTLAKHIGWLSDMTSWYNGSDYNALVNGTANWENYLDDANKAAEGIDSNMWMWGNVSEPIPGDVAYYAPVEYEQWPWFVVHP